ASCIAFQGSNLATFLSDGVVSSRRTRAEMSQSYALIASDGLPFAIHLSSPQKFWEGLCRSIGQPELIDDPRFVGKSDRIKNYDELLGILQQAATTDSRASWLERLRANDVPCAPILDVSEAIDHPQVRALGIIGYPSEGKPWVKAPIASDGEYLGAGIPAPLLSADADQILADIGLSEEEIAELRAKSVVC
ncbi:MAG: CoA transferase, partial [Actinobacteria bacterium]|nr:CoA transferase [Actinomycetota bacterium]